ncbi:MAG: ABC transporter permease [Anaerolineaceae bacterium]
MAEMTSTRTISRKSITIFLLDHTIEIMLIALVLLLSINVRGFMTWSNWMNILRANSMKGVIAFGMTMVIIAGMIDLSIGSQVALSGVIIARSCRDFVAGGMSLNQACILGIIIAVTLAILIAVLHGYFSHATKMQPFIVTLVTLGVLYGLAGIISEGFPIANQYPDWFNVLGGGRLNMPAWIVSFLGVKKIDGIPYPAIVLIVAYFLINYIMSYTTVGRSIYATGGNPESARLSGINVQRTKIICFIAVQLLAVVAGIMTAGQVLAGSYSFGRGWETDVISSVIIGGAVMTGGIGTVKGTLLGVIFMGVISNGMTLLNFDIYTQYVVRGLIMFLAVLLSTYRARVKA